MSLHGFATLDLFEDLPNALLQLPDGHLPHAPFLQDTFALTAAQAAQRAGIGVSRV